MHCLEILKNTHIIYNGTVAHGGREVGVGYGIWGMVFFKNRGVLTDIKISNKIMYLKCL